MIVMMAMMAMDGRAFLLSRLGRAGVGGGMSCPIAL